MARGSGGNRTASAQRRAREAKRAAATPDAQSGRPPEPAPNALEPAEPATEATTPAGPMTTKPPAAPPAATRVRQTPGVRPPRPPAMRDVNDRLLEMVDRVSLSYLVLAAVAFAAGLTASIVFTREDAEMSTSRALMLFNLGALASVGMIGLSMLAPRYLAAEYLRRAGLFALGLVYAASMVFDVMYVMFTLVFGFFGGDTTYLDDIPGWPR